MIFLPDLSLTKEALDFARTAFHRAMAQQSE
jgi:hypothetical protein